MDNSPASLFSEWYEAECRITSARIPSACCLSSIGDDGHPNARYVSLKELKDDSFIVTGPVNSRKGLEILANPKVALTFWWPHTEKQIRIQGTAVPLPREAAVHYFHERSVESQVASTICRQGQALVDVTDLELRFAEALARNEGQAVECPEDWGGFSIQPIRVEFLEFSPERLHRRTLFELETDTWTRSFLEP